MELLDSYLSDKVDVETAYCYVALEASLRAIESDCSIPPYRRQHLLDIRSMAHLESIQALRDLIRMFGFQLEFYKTVTSGSSPYRTPYGREVKVAWNSGHYQIQTDKGWLVLDYYVLSHALPYSA